jgi:RNA polymerase sigma factor for flagellar operon FliA
MVGKDPFSLCLREEMRSLLRTALEGLKQTEKQVIILYYLEERTMKEVGIAMGLGESRVSQIHSSALLRVRARLGEILRTNSKIGATAASSVR